MTYEQIPGWFDFGPLYDEMVARARPDAVFVEVGAYLGRSTAYLATRLLRAGKRVRLFVVDLWDGWFYDDYRQQTPMPESADVYWHFLHNMQACGVCHCLCPIKLPSERAAALFADASVDFVYLDGDHGGAAVRRDLEAWFPKIRPGGVLAGHDYLNKDFPGVRESADAFFAEKQLPLRALPGPAGGSFVATWPQPGTLVRVARRARGLFAPFLRSGERGA